MAGERHTGGADRSCGKEEQLLDLLYGELTPADEEGVRGHVPGCDDCSSALASYQRLRALVRELPDEEPPAAVTAQLLHAAAQQAATRGRRGRQGAGFWAWLSGLVHTVALHPAVAAAASLALVAGVAGVLYVRRGGEIARPRVPSSAPAPEEIHGAGGAAAPGPSATGDSAGSRDTKPTAGNGKPTEVVGTDALELAAPGHAAAAPEVVGGQIATTPEPTTSTGGTLSRRAVRTKPSRGGGGSATDKPTDMFDDAPAYETPGGAASGGKGGATRNPAKKEDHGPAEGEAAQPVLEPTPQPAPAKPEAPPFAQPPPLKAPQPKAPEYKKPPAQGPAQAPAQGSAGAPAPSAPATPPGPPPTATRPPPQEPAPQADEPRGNEDRGESAGDEEQVVTGTNKPSEKSPEDRRRDQARSLHGQAVAAAVRGDCSKATSLAHQIASIDAQYYERSVVTDKRLATCLRKNSK